MRRRCRNTDHVDRAPRDREIGDALERRLQRLPVRTAVVGRRAALRLAGSRHRTRSRAMGRQSGYASSRWAGAPCRPAPRCVPPSVVCTTWKSHTSPHVAPCSNAQPVVADTKLADTAKGGGTTKGLLALVGVVVAVGEVVSVPPAGGVSGLTCSSFAARSMKADEPVAERWSGPGEHHDTPRLPSPFTKRRRVLVSEPVSPQ